MCTNFRNFKGTWKHGRITEEGFEAANRRNLNRWIRNIVEEKVDDGDAEDEAKKKYLLDILKSFENLTINDASRSNTDESESTAADNTKKTGYKREICGAYA